MDTSSVGIAPDTSDSSPASVGQFLADASVIFESVTYTDPAPGVADNFIYIDVYTAGISRTFDVVATDGTKSVTQSTNNIVAACGMTFLGATYVNQWNVLSIDLTGQAMGSITQLTIVPHGGSFDSPIYFDNLRSSNSPCFSYAPTPSVTNTITPGGPTWTPTDTFTPGGPTPTPTWTPMPEVNVVSQGPSAPSNSTQPNGTGNVSVLQFQITNPAGVPVSMSGLTLTATGTGNDLTGIAAVHLYLDNNQNGFVDGGDTLLGSGTYSSDNGNVTFSFYNLIFSGGSATYLVTYDFSAAASGTYQSTIASSAAMTCLNSPGTEAFTGLPLSGAVITIGVGTVAPSATFTGSPQPTDTPTSTSTFTNTNTPGSPTSTPTVTFTNTPTGSATYTPTFTSTSTSTDTPTGSATYTKTNTWTVTPTSTSTFTNTSTPGSPTSTPTITFSNTPTGSATYTSTFTWTNTPTNTPLGSATYTTTYTSTSTFTPTPTGTWYSPTYTDTWTPSFTPTNPVTFTATNTFTPGGPTSTPTNTPTVTLTPITVSVIMGPVPPSNSAQSGGVSGVAVLQFQASNSVGVPVTITSLRLTASGSGNDAAGISNIHLFQDNNANGVVDGGDNLLTTSNYLSDNGTAVFNFYSVLMPSSTTTYLITYDFSIYGGAYSEAILSPTDLTGIFQNGAVQFSGLPLTGATITVSGPTPPPTATFTPANTLTFTPTYTSTVTSTPTPSGTWYTSTVTNTPSNTATNSPTNSPTNAVTFTSTITPTGTLPTATSTFTYTITDTATITPTGTLPTVTNTPTNTATDSPTNTPVGGVTLTSTHTPTPVGAPIAVVNQVVIPGLPATVTLSGGVTVSMAVSTFAQPATITISQYSSGSAPATSTAFQLNFMPYAYTIDAGGLLPGKSVTITLPYDPTLIPAGYTAADLTMTYFNGSSWITLPATIDTVNHTVTVVVSHFSWWGVAFRDHTPTPTHTPLPGGTPPKPVVYPNPATDSNPVHIRLNTTLVSDVKIQVFTTAFKKLQDFTVSNVPAGGDVTLVLMDKWNATLANGIYYVVVTTSQGKSVQKLLILK